MATNKPEGIVPSDKAVQIFGNIIAEAYKKLGVLMNGADYSTDQRRNALKKQLDEIVSETDEAVQAWVRVQIPNFYEQGMFTTVKELYDAGKEPEIKTSFAHFHAEAVKALMEDTYANIAQGMQGLTKTGQKLIADGARQSIVEKIASGKITGETRKEISKQVSDTLKNQGVSSLVDKAGRNWSLDRYGEMLARTKLTQSHNAGIFSQMAESGHDLVMISNHYGACPLCAPFEGKVLSATGATKGYTTIREAEGEGLFHPNCRHVPTPYHPLYLENSLIWDVDKQDYVEFKGKK